MREPLNSGSLILNEVKDLNQRLRHLSKAKNLVLNESNNFKEGDQWQAHGEQLY